LNSMVRILIGIRMMVMQRRTHGSRPVPPSLAKRDELPAITPIVGDVVIYLAGPRGDVIHPDDALGLMRQGKTVWYETWETDAPLFPKKQRRVWP